MAQREYEARKIIDNAKWYAHQEIVHIEESIKDYTDDDPVGNKSIIGDLKEEKAHWQDIEKLLNGQDKDELYMDWRGFEYE